MRSARRAIAWRGDPVLFANGVRNVFRPSHSSTRATVAFRWARCRGSKRVEVLLTPGLSRHTPLRNLMLRQHYSCIDILGGLKESVGASTCRWRCPRMVRATSFERSNGVIVAVCTASETNRHRWHLASDRGGTSVGAAEDLSELCTVRSTRPRRYRGTFRTKAFGPRIYELPLSATFYIARGGLFSSSCSFLIVERTHLGRVTASFGCTISVRDERGSATRTTCKPILYQSKQQTAIESLQNLYARIRHDQGH